MDNQENQQRQDLPLDSSLHENIPEVSQPGETLSMDAEVIASPVLDQSTIEDINKIIEETLTEFKSAPQESQDPAPDTSLPENNPEVSQPTEILPAVNEALPASDPDQPTIGDVDTIIEETLTEYRSVPQQTQEVSMDATQIIQQPPFKDEEYRDAFGTGEEPESLFQTSKKSRPRKEPRQSAPSDRLEAFPGMEDEEPEEEIEQEQPPVRKKRPHRKGKDNLFGLSHLLVTCVWLAIIIFIGVTLANVLWVCASDVLAFGRESHETSVTIEDTDTIEDIARKLNEAGLVRYPNLFSLYAQFTGAREDISSGTFTLNTIYDYHALVNFMSFDSAEREVVDVLIPEGYNCAQLFALLEEKGVCTAAELEIYAATGELDEYWFLEDVQRGSRYCLEGFLFPDTYQFYIGDEPRRVLEKMLDNFDYRFTDKMRSDLINLNHRITEWMEDEGCSDEYIAEHQLTLRELVIVASLIEEETANTLESYTISSVIYNRLYRWGDTPSFLGIDAAIIYALGEHKEELTYADLEIDSPYNTYKYTGLTPGPITNPGLHSLNAALDPDDTDYYYYAMDPDTGAHHFSRNSYEHDEFLESLEDD